MLSNDLEHLVAEYSRFSFIALSGDVANVSTADPCDLCSARQF